MGDKGFWADLGEDIGKGVSWLGDHEDGIGAGLNLALGGVSLYQSGKASDTASNFYDAAGQTAQQRWDMIAPLEQAKVDRELTNMTLTEGLDEKMIDAQSQELDFNSMLLEYQSSMLPDQMDFATQLFEYQQANLPQEQALYQQTMGLQGQMMDTAQGDIEQYEKYRGVDDEYFRQSMEGIDPGQESDKAQADVAQAFAGTMDAASRELARRGVGPDSAAYQGQVNNNAIQQAKAMGSARTTARSYAEDVNYNRLGSAMNARQGLAPATTGAVTAPSGTLLPTASSVQSPNVYTPSNADPTNTYLDLGDAAAIGADASSSTGWDLIQRGINE